MTDNNASWHAHVYYDAAERDAADSLRGEFGAMMAKEDVPVLYVGRMTDRPIGPHPVPQFEVHFAEPGAPAITAAIERSGLRALLHPLTDDDMADHTSLGRWIGEPLELDLSVLDPPGENQGVARFGKGDF